ncbi:MFS transporter [Terracidiphilus gabretensis]|uniref:MFS transporter n=1 Tax=Terracidiphilus gabretensis TaxID=1577687 RepID=UPI00071BFCA4|nr:MFS transporter [Terracidiphilus gabretensis]
MNITSEQSPQKELAPGARIGKVRWTICAMLFAATSINYMDRQVLSLLKPTLMHAPALGGIGMTEVGYGYIMAAFQVSYAIGLLAAGRFVDKVGTRIGYMAIMAVWSLSAMGHALVNSMFQFGIARVCLGLGESGNFPAAIKTVAEWFPQRERSLATGIFNSGANMGAILAPAIVPWVALHYSWHAAFLVTGVFSAAWIGLWYSKYRKPQDHPTLTGAELRFIYEEAAAKMGPSVPWMRLLGYRQTWAFAIGKGLTDPIWWFFLFWLPDFFSKKYGLDLKHVGLPLIVVYTASSIGSIGGGWLPMPLRKFGLSAVAARLTAMFICACAVTPIFIVNSLNSEWATIGLLSLATAAHQGWSANIYTTASDMFPKSAVGSVTGIGGMAGSACGSLFAIFVGYVLQLTHSNYTVLFGIAASAYLVAFAFLNLLAPGLRKAEFAA